MCMNINMTKIFTVICLVIKEVIRIISPVHHTVSPHVSPVEIISIIPWHPGMDQGCHVYHQQQ